MDSVSTNSNSKIRRLEDDATLSTLRRRNKTLILIMFFIIFLALIIGVLIFYLVANNRLEYDRSISFNPAVHAYYSIACYSRSCLGNYINRVTAPEHRLTRSLQTAAKQLDNITSLILSYDSHTDTDQSALKNCSRTLRDGLDRIEDALGTMRVNPVVENQSNEQRDEMRNRIMVAEENLKSCLGDLGRVTGQEPRAVSEVKEKVAEAKVQLSSCVKFLANYEGQKPSRDWGAMILENLFGVCVGGLQLLFMCFLFWTLYRF